MSQLYWSEKLTPDKPRSQPMAWAEIGFRQFWIFSIVLAVLNIGRLTGVNTNPVEKSMFLIALLFLCIKNPVNKTALTFLGMMSLPIFVLGAYTLYPEFSWVRLNMAYVALLSIVGFYVVTPTRRDMELVLKSIAILPVVMLAYGGLLFLLFGKPLTMQDHTGAMRLAGGTMPAFLAAASYAASVAAAYLFCNSRRAVFLFLCLAALVVCALSGTRTPTVVAAASVGAVLFLRFTGVQRVALVVIGSVALAIFLLTIGDQLVMRFMSSSSSGRELIWNIVESWVARYPHTGIGFGHCGAVIPWYVSRMTGTEATHNEYLRLALELGYWGTICFMGGFLLLCMTAIKRFSFEALALFALFFLYAYTDNVFFLTYALLGPLACIYGVLLTRAEEPRQAPVR
jgi:O-antigen ligase